MMKVFKKPGEKPGTGKEQVASPAVEGQMPIVGELLNLGRIPLGKRFGQILGPGSTFGPPLKPGEKFRTLKDRLLAKKWGI